jgi:hypothetical protein
LNQQHKHQPPIKNTTNLSIKKQVLPGTTPDRKSNLEATAERNKNKIANQLIKQGRRSKAEGRRKQTTQRVYLYTLKKRKKTKKLMSESLQKHYIKQVGDAKIK